MPEPDVPPHLEPAVLEELDDATTAAVDITGAVLPALTGAQVDSSDLSRLRANAGQWQRVTLADCRLDGAEDALALLPALARELGITITR